MTTTIQAVLDKVRKLRRLATSSNPHEAANAARLAERLIQEHRLSEAEFGDAGWLSGGPAEDPVPLYFGSRVQAWAWRLAIVLAAHYDCAAYASKRRQPTLCKACGEPLSRTPRACPKKARAVRCSGTPTGIERTMHLVGREDDVRIVKEQYAYFHAEIARLSEQAARVAKADHGVTLARSAMQSFRLGCVMGIRDAMIDAKRVVVAGASKSAAMVLASRADASDEAMQRLYPGMKKGGRKPSLGAVTDDMAYEVGRRSGRDLEGRARAKRLTKHAGADAAHDKEEP